MIDPRPDLAIDEEESERADVSRSEDWRPSDDPRSPTRVGSSDRDLPAEQRTEDDESRESNPERS